MTEAEFMKDVKRRVASLREERDYSNDGDAFCHVAMQILLDLTPDDATDACDIGGSNDKGLDAFYDDDRGHITLAQARFSNRTQDADGVLQLERALHWLQTHKQFSSGTPLPSKLVEAASAVRAALAPNSAKRITLLAITSTRWSDGAVKERNRVDAKLPDNVEIHLIDRGDLYSAELDRVSRLDLKPVNATLPIKDHFEYKPAGGPKALVAVVDGGELAKLQVEYRYRLFQRNVRYFIGAGSGQRVNQGIQTTLLDPSTRRNFWYFNNGVAVVCDSVEVTGEGDDAQAVIENLQIVNGCQTTTTLGEMIDELDGDARADLLVRFIQTDDEDLQRSITRYTNKQNAVRDRDLMANEDLQGQLQQQFSALKPAWYYERKRGGYKSEIQPKASRRKRFERPGEKRIIDNERAAQATYAFYIDPAVARARKRNLFITTQEDPEGLYDAVFNDDVTPYTLLLPFQLSTRIAAERKQFTREYKATKEAVEATRGNPDSDQARVMAREWVKFADEFFLGGFGLHLSKRVDIRDDDVLKRLVDPKHLDKVFKRLYKILLVDLGSHFRLLSAGAQRREESFSASNYVKLPVNWRATAVHLEEAWEVRADESDPLAGLPLDADA